jgi:type IV pilus assembly protein PilE
MKRLNQKGFTLVELMIVVAIVGILARIAYPSYVAHIARGKRVEAEAALIQLAQFMERYYTEQQRYSGATLSQTTVPANSATPNYNLTLTTTAATFSITAAPTGSQTGDKCGTLGINQLGQKSASSTAGIPCW